MHGKPDGTGPSERRSRPRLVSGRGPPLRGGKDSPERAYRSEGPVSAGVPMLPVSNASEHRLFTQLSLKKSTDYQNQQAGET